MKKCPVCTVIKPLDEFYRSSKSHNGRGGYCKPCADRKKMDWNNRNPEKKRVYVATGYTRHHVARYERLKARRALNPRKRRAEYLASYRRNAANIIARTKLKRQQDMGYRMGRSLSARLVYAIKGKCLKKRPGMALELLGCSMDSFRLYLESKFEPGMTWQNYGRNGWEIDHIMPCAIFDLSNPEHQKRCFHFSNLQPLWMHDNRTKSRKISTQQTSL